MSSQSVIVPAGANGQALQVNTNVAKVFLWNRRSELGIMTNGTGAPITYPIGTVMGRIGATNKLVPFTSAAVDGSGIPIGVLADTYVIGAGVTTNVFMCVSGDVAAEQLLFQGGDTLETIIATRRVKDMLQGSSVGIKLVYGNEMTIVDNSL